MTRENSRPWELQTLTKQLVVRLDSIIGPDRDIPAPDMGTGAREMAWMVEAYSKTHGFEPGVVTGKPVGIGGSPGRIEATGRGVALMTKLAMRAAGNEIKTTTVAIQGFGIVGSHAAHFLHQQGAKIVAICDDKTALHNAAGLDVARAVQLVNEGSDRPPVSELGLEATTIPGDELLTLDVDVLIPAAISDVIHEGNVRDIRANLVVEAANIPVTPEADRILTKQDITIVPDILANAGGVTASYFEWVQNRQRYRWDIERVYGDLDDRLSQAWSDVHHRAVSDEIPLRLAAYSIAVERTRDAISMRGF